MLFYFFVFVVIAFLALLSNGKSLKDQRIISLISSLVILCFQGFRWRTGTDWDPYLDCFLRPDIFKEDYEFGYYIFNKAIRYFTDSYTVFLFIQCLIIIICFIKFASYFKVKNISLVLLYYFVSTPFPIRYTLAVAVFLLSYKYVVEKQIIKFIIVLFVSISIHQIVVVALPIYFLARKHFSSKSILILYVLSCIIGFMTEFVFNNIFQLANTLFQYMPAFSQYKAEAYLVESDSQRSLFSMISSVLNGFVFICLFLYIRKLYYKEDIKYNILLNLYVIGLCFGRIVIEAIPYLARSIACFSGGFILMIILGIEAIHLRKKRDSILLKSIFLNAMFIYLFVIYYGQLVFYYPVFVPYYSIFSSTTRTVIF